MKKLMFAIGVFSFLLIGAVSVDTVNASTVYDDPPKKETKRKTIDLRRKGYFKQKAKAI